MKDILKQQYAIIDIGSNTMRLVIYEKQSGGFYKEIENTKVVARLRNYLIDGSLTEDGIGILLQTLLQFQESTRFHSLHHVLCVATATIRQAENQDEIKKVIEGKTDFTLKILSEYEEARYGYLAVMNSTSFTEGVTVDIGGGSTEVTYFRDREIIEYYSFPFGALSLKQQFIRHEVPTAEELDELRRYLWYQFRTLPWLNDKKLPLIAIGGSARNMVEIHQNLISYPIAGLHLYKMKEANIKDVKDELKSLSFMELQKLDGLAKDRADTIIPAVEVFHMLVNIVQAPAFVLSRKGLREGVFYEELTKDLGVSYYPNVVEESLNLLSYEYEMDMEFAIQLIKHGTLICKQLEEANIISLSEKDWEVFYRAAKVFNIGKYIDDEASHLHTFYLLANKTIDGMMHKDRVRLALIASYKSKMLFKQYVVPFEDWFDKSEQKKIRLLGAILQFSAALNVRQRALVETIRVEKNKDGLVFFIACRQLALAEKVQAEKQKKQLEKALKMNIHLIFEE
ncbi:Ppx/GppA family phosphatase [Bacillus clarus]|uniref:Ppx/GppA family phosphatase n=1 Tax=Bacillus clarus TaxID=2338372 RepID=A0A090YRX6_9BACI|nr:Ppx/GppA family phosphatase [Bacillus clarus]KFN01170.1 ppx/GppA phosphatase family protein [Bacillus clarus]RFT68790.1 Ppx/GppA family phosphatase [Bacillus clarus]